MSQANALTKAFHLSIGIRTQRSPNNLRTNCPWEVERSQGGTGVQQLIRTAAETTSCGFKIAAVGFRHSGTAGAATSLIDELAQVLYNRSTVDASNAMPQHHWLAMASMLAVVSLGGAAIPVGAADPKALVQTLDERSCKGCNLKDADLVHADLRDARLQGAQLQRANLSGARLDGADLRHADLSFTSLAGASLQGADLRGATLTGTDFRNSNLSDAQLEPGSLSRSHWQEARGVSASLHSYAELHNAGVQAALNHRHPEAERWFSEAIKRMPNAAISWVARGISRAEQGNFTLASQDLRYAGTLYTQLGNQEEAEALTKAAERLIQPSQRPKGGNGIGSQLMTGALAAFQFLAPLAAKTMLPMPF